MLFSQVNCRFTAQDKNLGKKAKPVNPKGNQPWIFTKRTDAKAPTLWPPDAKSWLTGKDSGAEKDWGQEKRRTEDEIVGWHYQLDGHEFGWTPGAGDGQGGLDATVHAVTKSWTWLTEQQQTQWHIQSIHWCYVFIMIITSFIHFRIPKPLQFPDTNVKNTGRIEKIIL